MRRLRVSTHSPAAPKATMSTITATMGIGLPIAADMMTDAMTAAPIAQNCHSFFWYTR